MSNVSRFVLRYAGPAAPPAQTQRIRSSAKVHVLDDSPKMLLVEGEDSDVETLLADLPDWKALREQSVRLPDGRPKLDRPDGQR